MKVKSLLISFLTIAVALSGCCGNKATSQCCGSAAPQFSKKLPVGVQLYSVRTDLEKDFYGTLKAVKEMGYAGVDPAQFRKTVAKIGEIGSKVKAAGFQLLYHNHDFEFVDMGDGSLGYDYIFSSNDRSSLQNEIDVCWVDYAGES